MLEQPKPPNPDVVADARRLEAVGADRETILVFLRDRGLNKIDSIKTIRGLYGLSMPEAKDLIDQSAAWSDRFDHDMEFRKTAIKALRDLAASKDPSLPNIVFDERTDEDRGSK
jgi:hypothetical protein